MRADTVHAWAVAAAGAPVIVLVHLGLTGTTPAPHAVLGTVAAFVVTAWSLGRLLPRLVPAADGLLGRSLIATLSILAGQAMLAVLDVSARTDGCLPTVGRGARVGYGWLALNPVVPCADGVAATPLTLAAATAAIAATGAALGLVLAQLGVALAAATVGLRVLAAASLTVLADRLTAAAATLSRFCLPPVAALLGARPPALSAVAPRPGHVIAAASRPDTWFRVPTRRGPPVPAIARPC